MTVRTVVGLDLSLSCTGIATVDPDGHVSLETVRSAGRADDSLRDRHERLDSLSYRIQDEIPGDALVVVEAAAYSARVGHQHDRSGLWWAVVSGLLRQCIEVIAAEPAVVKKYATGNGAADKMAVRDAAHDRLGVRPDTHDEADALWLAAIGRDLLGAPLVDLPKKHRDALAKVRTEGLT